LKENSVARIARSKVTGSRGLQSAAFFFQDRAVLNLIETEISNSDGEIYGAVAISGFEAELNAKDTNFTDNHSGTGASHIYGDQGLSFPQSFSNSPFLLFDDIANILLYLNSQRKLNHPGECENIERRNTKLRGLRASWTQWRA